MRQWTIDAFAAAAFHGNQACVLEPMAAWPDAAWMQALAAENNQAETAFLVRTQDPACFGLRWFTPALEVPLCGHATLASGHVLFAELGLAADKITFDTKSGSLTLRRAGKGYEMNFPAQPPTKIVTPPGLAQALGAEPVEVWASTYLVAILNDEAAVHACRPDLVALEAVSSNATGGRGNVGISALADPGQPYDVVDRFFAPGSGIPEDPATGSLHCILTPLFADKLGRARVKFLQAYPGRGGDLDCELVGDRVLLRGRAVTVLDGMLRVEP
jgi:PhzF family phenazine biosynthesis protein